MISARVGTVREATFEDGTTDRLAYASRATDDQYDAPACHWQSRDNIGSALRDALFGADVVRLTLMRPRSFGGQA